MSFMNIQSLCSFVQTCRVHYQLRTEKCVWNHGFNHFTKTSKIGRSVACLRSSFTDLKAPAYLNVLWYQASIFQQWVDAFGKTWTISFNTFMQYFLVKYGSLTLSNANKFIDVMQMLLKPTDHGRHVMNDKEFDNFFSIGNLFVNTDLATKWGIVLDHLSKIVFRADPTYKLLIIWKTLKSLMIIQKDSCMVTPEGFARLVSWFGKMHGCTKICDNEIMRRIGMTLLCNGFHGMVSSSEIRRKLKGHQNGTYAFCFSRFPGDYVISSINEGTFKKGRIHWNGEHFLLDIQGFNFKFRSLQDIVCAYGRTLEVPMCI